MRPRISRAEARYIAEVLKAQREQQQKKQQRLEWLRLEVYRLRQMLIYDTYRATKEHIREKKDELAALERQTSDLFWSIETHNRLIAKYTAIAEGQAHDGRYKHLSCRDLFYPLVVVTR